MVSMKRGLVLYPVGVAMVWAQQVSPASEEAKKALTERVQQFYQLQMEKKYRQAEAFVAEDTKDLYYGSGKGDLLGFSIVKIELSEGDTKAKVSVKAKSQMLMMGTGMLPYEVVSVTLWKVENGKWCWYVDQTAPVDSLFGKLKGLKSGGPGGAPDFSKMVTKPDLGDLISKVHADRNSATVTAAQPLQTVTITNDLPGPADLTVSGKIAGVTVETDKTHLVGGEKATVRLRRTEDVAAEGVVYVEVAPLNSQLQIQVKNEKK